ncbi:NADP-dependent oxidoreductase domain-containing protein [Endogone sp. FLAS-F59071]|nr:NADP-dependent oxidoreductase domain-containing protein [Endogone sp. FLAS-F59071]|eukprot:RUS20094.1 NADP-dependent oxidoreductase domain-containing protein [Endogone sp. FLAS-F59071]
MATENLTISALIIPTVETKITLAGELDVPPIGGWVGGIGGIRKNQVKVSVILDSTPQFNTAIGCWSWGDQASPLNCAKFYVLCHLRPASIITRKWTPNSEKDAQEVFDFAISRGISFFDTAEAYGAGESEREIQRFREHYTEEERNRQVIATKYAPWRERIVMPDCLLLALKGSLARLGMAKVDLYHIQGPIHVQKVEVVGR